MPIFTNPTPMDSPSKPTSFRTKLVSLAVLIFAVRFIYVLSISSYGYGFFFPPSQSQSLPIPTSSNPAWQRRDFRKLVDFHSSVFQDLLADGFLAPSFKCLLAGTLHGQDVLALKEIGVPDAVGVSKKQSPPLVVAADLLNLNFPNSTFDFVFLGKRIDDEVSTPLLLALEFVRVLKPEGFLVVLTGSAGDAYSSYNLQNLFPLCRKVRSREIDGGVSESKKVLREVVFQKEETRVVDNGIVNSVGDSEIKCSVSEQKLELVHRAEPLIQEEPAKPWITLKKNIQNIKYLSSVVDISFKRRYVYIDIGARSYGSSIGSWFKKQYPKQNHTFEIFAIEADKAFHKEYLTKKGVKLLPYAAWVRNESLSFEVNHNKDQKSDEKGGKGMGRIRPTGLPLDGKSVGDLHSIQGFDFAEWLKNTVTEKDFVVMKMDVEGTEFDLIPRLFETGAICLIDELFLECHYNRWQRCCPGERSPKYEYSYGQCLELFTSLRDNGVLVHQWW